MPSKFTIAVKDGNTWSEVVETCLGGQQLDAFALTRHLVTQGTHQLHYLVMDFLSAMADYNTANAPFPLRSAT